MSSQKPSPEGRPLVSVVIPAFRAEASVLRAVASVLEAGIPADQLEILIESDDGQDYARAAALSPAVRVAVTGAVASGVGPARNRAMARARGDWLAFLDADDWVAPGYLAALLPGARVRGAAAAPLVVTQAGETVLSLWQGQARLDLADLAASGASVRLMVARASCPPFIDALSQDILHAVHVMADAGGALPLSDRAYHLTLSPGSVTAAQDFSTRVAQAYHDHIRRIQALGLPADMAGAAANVFEAKLALNAAFQASGMSDYYRFVARCLDAVATADGEAGNAQG